MIMTAPMVGKITHTQWREEDGKQKGGARRNTTKI
jgi:hypothetical protein